jgi:N-acetylmuramoyl-L-alanine amidase
MIHKTLLSLLFISVALFSKTFARITFYPGPIKTIIIDPGHGGKDQGASGLVTTEAKICLAIGKRLGQAIEKELPGVKVLYTRTTDIIPGNKSDKNEGLRYRADFANNSKADLFISIHCNSAGRQPGGWYEKRIIDYNEKITYKGKGKKRRKIVTKVPVYQPYYVVNETNGTETYIWTAAENAHKVSMVNTQNEFSAEEDSTVTVPENDPVVNALKLIYTKKYFLKSLKLADLVQKEFEKSGRINRGVKQRNEKGIWVLHATGMPSILIETGFISNKEEEAYLNSERGQEEIVDNIISALKNYIGNQEHPAVSSENVTSFANKAPEPTLTFHREAFY